MSFLIERVRINIFCFRDEEFLSGLGMTFGKGINDSISAGNNGDESGIISGTRLVSNGFCQPENGNGGTLTAASNNISDSISHHHSNYLQNTSYSSISVPSECLSTPVLVGSENTHLSNSPEIGTQRPAISDSSTGDDIQILGLQEKSRPNSVSTNSSGSPAAALSGNNGFQLVNGQLVVQAQLQTVQTPKGLVTVAVLPPSLVKPVVMQMQQQNGEIVFLRYTHIRQFYLFGILRIFAKLNGTTTNFKCTSLRYY